MPTREDHTQATDGALMRLIDRVFPWWPGAAARRWERDSAASRAVRVKENAWAHKRALAKTSPTDAEMGEIWTADVDFPGIERKPGERLVYVVRHFDEVVEVAHVTRQDRSSAADYIAVPANLDGYADGTVYVSLSDVVVAYDRLDRPQGSPGAKFWHDRVEAVAAQDPDYTPVDYAAVRASWRAATPRTSTPAATGSSSPRTARPGQIWWAELPFEDNPLDAKDRPVLVIENTGTTLVVAKVTSKDKSTRYDFIKIPDGTDGLGDTCGYLSLRTTTIGYDEVRRYAGDPGANFLIRYNRARAAAGIDTAH